jgi:hypothetical protein
MRVNKADQRSKNADLFPELFGYTGTVVRWVQKLRGGKTIHL